MTDEKTVAQNTDLEIKDFIKEQLEKTHDPAMVSALLVKNASMMSIAFCSNGHAITSNLLSAFLAPVEAYLAAEAEAESDVIDGEVAVDAEGFEVRPKDAIVN